MKHLDKVKGQPRAKKDLSEALTISRAMFETCHNPLCKGPLGKRKRKPRKFCSNQCRFITWVFRRTANMLLPLGRKRGWKILEKLNNSQVKAGVESLNSEGN